MREFEKGWVLVNPTDGYTNASDARNVTLPGPGRVRTHENLHKAAETLPVVHTIEVLSAHRGLFVLKAAVPRLKPARMAPEKVSQQQQPQQQQAGEPENFWKKIFKVGRPSRFESTSVKTDDETPSSATTGQPPKSWPSHYDVIWTERGDWSSAHALGSMPLGSGITGCNVWVDDTGIRLLFGSTDSYDEHNLLMKLGQVGIELKPNPFSTLPPPPPPPSPPYHGNRSAMSSYTRRGGVIGCASEDGCVDPHDSAQMRIHNCTSAATCHIEAAAACGAWSMCTSFSISHNWHSGAAAQMFSCARRFASDGAWSSWQLKNSTCQPLPPKRYPTFKQRLDLNRGLVTLKSGPLQLEIWVDWIHDVTRIRLNTTDGSAFGARVVSQNWRNVTRPIVGDELQPMGLCLGEFGIAENITRQKDTTVESSGELLWYRRNPERTVVTATMEQQLLPLSALHNPVTGKQLDILSNNTFGLLVQSSASSPVELHSVGTGGTVLETSETTGMLELQISAHVAQTPSAQTWMAQLRAKAAKAAAVSYETALQAHAAHWAAIWQRSWFDTLAEPGTDSYNQSFGFALGRYVNLCQGRGKTPTHFTGGIFYQAAKGESGIDPQYNRYDYDWRSWGAPYWWQNTRFAYDPMISDGDFDHLAPLFDMYTDQMTVSEALVKRYYKHSGAKFYETGEPWGATVMDQWGCAKSPGAQCGCFGNCTVGRNPKICRPSDLYTRGVCTKLNVTNSDCDEQNPYIRHHWSSALELPLMMLRYFLVSGNVTAAQKWLVPVATQTMTFFKEHWQNASFFLQDAQALESYSHCDQPSCQLAGMRQLLRGLLLSQVKSLFAPSLQALFASMHALVLAIKLPVFTSLNTLRHSEKFHNQSQLPLLAPCAMGGVATKGYQPPKWTQQNNEPIAMYAVWPYELFGVNRSGMQSLIPASLGLDTDEKVLEFARASYNLQPYPGRPEGYNMISVFSANLGLANTTKDFLHYKWSEAVKAGPFDYTSSRFPVWWGPSNRGGEVCDDPSCNEIADEVRRPIHIFLAHPGTF
eukprot:COSAG01_NODE_1129_length_11575_cov_19.751917_7_plen_1038_part_00